MNNESIRCILGKCSLRARTPLDVTLVKEASSSPAETWSSTIKRHLESLLVLHYSRLDNDDLLERAYAIGMAKGADDHWYTAAQYIAKKELAAAIPPTPAHAVGFQPTSPFREWKFLLAKRPKNTFPEAATPVSLSLKAA